MSYCVECGVRLADSEKICPLCNTKVINPNHPEDMEHDRPYPSRVQQINGLKRRELAWVVFLFLLVPVAATVIIDLLTGGVPFSLSWSVIVIGVGAMLAVWTLVPIIFPKLSVYLHMAIDSAAVAGLLAIIAAYLGDWQWCVGLGIPIVAATCIAACGMVAIVRSSLLRPITRAACACLVIGVFIVALELIIDHYTLGILAVTWSLYAIVPLVSLALLLLFISRKPGLMDELKRRLFA